MWFSHSRRTTEAPPRRLAVLPFENLSGDAGLDWTEPLFPFALARQFEGVPKFIVSASATSAIAASSGATHEVAGYLTREGGALVVHFAVLDVKAHRELDRGAVHLKNKDWPARLAALAAAVGKAAGGGTPTRPPSVHNDEAVKLLAEAVSYSASDPTAAASRFESATAADPACGWCWEGWVDHAARTAGAPQVQAVIQRSRAAGVQLDALSRARIDLVDATLRNDLPARLAALQRLTEALPSDPLPKSQLADVLVAMRQFDRASHTYQSAISLDPLRGELWNSLAYSLAYAGKYKEADAAVQRYSQLDKSSANPLDSQGEVSLMSGQFQEAARVLIASYEKDKNFNSGAALEKAALAHVLNGDRKEAGQLLDRYLSDRTRSDDPWVEVIRARWEYVVGQTATSRARLQRIAGTPSDPLAPVAASLLALHAVAEGDLPAARAAARSALSQSRNAGQAYLAAFAAVAADPSSAAAYFNDPASRTESRAYALTLRGDWPAAADAWRESLRYARGGADGPHRELLALCLVSSGRAGDAASLVSTGWPILNRDQTLIYDFLIYPNLFYVRAEAALAQKKSADAIRNYDLFLQYAGDRTDRFGRLARAKAAARL